MSEQDDQVSPGLDYKLCRFEGTKLVFRGPAPDLEESFVAVLGGSEAYGKYVQDPFPSLLGEWVGVPVLNLGVQHAGLSLFSQERWLLETASRAQLTVLQVLGAQNMSNRLYRVHARRNDRFLSVSPALRDMYPDVDFAEVNFTGHLLETLKERSETAFRTLMEELKWAWVQRMKRVVQLIDGDVLLLWVSDRRPDDTSDDFQENEPMFVDRDMLDAVWDEVSGVVEIVRPIHTSLEGKVFGDGEEMAAETLPGPADHARIAEALAPEVAQLLGRPDAASRVRASG